MLAPTHRQPAHYPFLPFHVIRTLSLVSALIVTGVIIYFCYHLNHDNYKIPWTFLVMLAASTITLIALVLTFLIHVCSTLSPLFNLILNIPLFLLWTVGAGLLGWNMYGTLGHACNTQNWGSSDGVFVCETYKALFSFAVIGWCAAVAAIILDIRVRRMQMRLGKYDQMTDSKENLNMATFESNGRARMPEAPEVPYGIEQYHGEGTQYKDGSVTSRTNVSMHDFEYTAPSEQTTYDPGSYGHGGRY